MNGQTIEGWQPIALLVLAGAIVGGISGGGIVLAIVGTGGETVRAKTIEADTIQFQELISKEGDRITCRIKDGVILAEKQVMAGEVRGRILCGSNILAATNPISNLKDTVVYAELAATQGGGGVFSLRNQHGGVLPGQPQNAAGNVMVLGYDSRGEPIIFTQNVVLGEKGIQYLYRTPTPAQTPSAGSEAEGKETPSTSSSASTPTPPPAQPKKSPAQK